MVIFMREVSVKLSIKAHASGGKFWRINPNSILFYQQFTNFHVSEMMPQTVSIRV